MIQIRKLHCKQASTMCSPIDAHAATENNKRSMRKHNKVFPSKGPSQLLTRRALSCSYSPKPQHPLKRPDGKIDQRLQLVRTNSTLYRHFSFLKEYQPQKVCRGTFLNPVCARRFVIIVSYHIISFKSVHHSRRQRSPRWLFVFGPLRIPDLGRRTGHGPSTSHRHRRCRPSLA
jgi:hypothetical protein